MVRWVKIVGNQYFGFWVLGLVLFALQEIPYMLMPLFHLETNPIMNMTEAPAKLVGWFDRVWTYGFAYGEKTMKELDKAVILCSAGNPIERLEESGLLDSMKKVMLGDRLFGRAKQTGFVVFDNTSRENELREKNWDMNIQKAYEMEKDFF